MATRANGTTKKARRTPMTVEQAQYWVTHQEQWILEHGGTLDGYVARYGPFPCRACGGSGTRDTVACGACDSGTYVYGNGGAAIYAADVGALAEHRAALATAIARRDKRGTVPAAEPAALTKREALAILDDAGGHAYLTVSAGEKISRAFGLALAPARQPANTGEHKGLMVKGAKPGELVSGYPCERLACAIAEHLADAHDATTSPPLDRVYRMQEGRGSRARSACETITAALDALRRVAAKVAAPGDRRYLLRGNVSLVILGSGTTPRPNSHTTGDRPMATPTVTVTVQRTRAGFWRAVVYQGTPDGGYVLASWSDRDQAEAVETARADAYNVVHVALDDDTADAVLAAPLVVVPDTPVRVGERAAFDRMTGSGARRVVVHVVSINGAGDMAIVRRERDKVEQAIEMRRLHTI